MNQDHNPTGPTIPVLACRSCGSRMTEDDMPQDGTCAWCGGRHLTAYTIPVLLIEAGEVTR